MTLFQLCIVGFQWPSCRRPLDGWGRGFKFLRGHICVFVSCVCCVLCR